MIERVYGEVWEEHYPASGGRPWKVMGEAGPVGCKDAGEAMQYSASLDAERIKWSIVGAMCKITDRYGFNESDVPEAEYLRWMSLSAQLYPMLNDAERAVHSIYGVPGLRDGRTVTYPEGTAAARAVQYAKDRLAEFAHKQENRQNLEARVLARIRDRVQEPDDNVLRYFVLNDLPPLISELQQLERCRRSTAEQEEWVKEILTMLG